MKNKFKIKNKFQNIFFPLLFLVCFVMSANSQNKFDMQQWTGAWGSDGLINTGDLNGDGKTDVFMWKDAIKTWTVNISNGTGFTMQAWPGWGTTAKVYTGFLNNDRKTDVFFWDDMEKVWRINLSTGSGFEKTTWTGAWGSDGPINVGDLNKDKKTDVFMWRDSDKSWMVNLSTGSGFAMQRWTGAWGSDGPINVADLNGDEMDDVFMWRDSKKDWTVNLSTGSGFTMQRWTGAWGSDGEIHIGDLNYDKKTDVFMWRDAEGWQVNLSTGTGFINEKWVGACKQNYMSKTGDFNGDGKTDVAIWKDATKEWMINFSTGYGFKIETYTGAWGSDGPIFTGFLNDDRKADIFMWRGGDNTWMINLSNPLLPGFVIGKTTVSDCASEVKTNNPQLFDISPESINGTWISESKSKNIYTSGVILSITSDRNDNLYAVSQSAGIWKTQRKSNGEFESWRQLENSPPYAYCIAVDPQFPNHIVVGEKDGEKNIIEDNHCGFWESFDGGKTFEEKYYYDPLNNICKCTDCIKSQNITDVIITNKSTTIIATPCGLARKSYLGSFEIINGVNGQITALSIFGDIIVARSAENIYISKDDGKTWKTYLIQYNFSDKNFLQYDDRRAGLHSIAIINTKINEIQKSFIYLPATQSPNPDNKCSILIFDLQSEKWNYQIMNIGLGTGMGSGRVQIKSCYIDATDLKETLGEKIQLIYGNAQGFFKATKINTDGTASWQLFAESDLGGCNYCRFHADVWDFHISEIGEYAFIATDGGIHYRKLDINSNSRLNNLNYGDYWMNLNEGLHTHNINNIAISYFLAPSNSILQIGTSQTDKVTYSTVHNQAWKTNAISDDPTTINNWKVVYGLGDVSSSHTDWANGYLNYNFRTFYDPYHYPGGTAILDHFGGYVPSGSKIGKKNLLAYDPGEIPVSFYFIQSLKGEQAPEYLDMVMMVPLPLQKYGNPPQHVNGLLGQGSWNNKLAIVRNKEFAKTPTTDDQNADGWEIVFSDLPEGSIGFQVSGGHNSPTFFVFTNENKVFKRTISDSNWELLEINLPSPYINFFINPFNPETIYATCIDGVFFLKKNSLANISEFVKDDALTNFITGNGDYDISTTYYRRAGDYCLGANTHIGLGSISSMAFNPVNPNQIVCSSPFTGLFFKDGDKEWTSLSSILPKPFTPITSTAITPNGIYVGTAGRGLLLIKNYLNSTEINEKNTKKKITPGGVYPNKIPQVESIENSKNCSRTISYWFDGSSVKWPDINGTEPGNITIAGTNYDEKTGRLIGNYSSPTNQYDVKHAFILLATLKLSQINPDYTVWNYAIACEKWLAGLRKITPDNIQVKNEKMIPVLKQIENWINANLCK